ncbi:DUF2953 domain-containing protein [Yoonia sediminilitoris]|uniref:DUF2953 family protein n=1 Tax=Yoonia sediminilitoris TaxID=1286148 RepID=A0A2T6KMN2_9RHOB|nr:DUF2953 domain-containing protein [Yoonia sediminilitoris]PUB17479.1 Protein of unknown function (DUF2953) [Yoonia sediminilitoris]RCW97774.1 DUF2953 family protein [Yoonia sediminilitoris]
MAVQILLWSGVALALMILPLVSLPVYVQMSLQWNVIRRATVSLRPLGGVFPSIMVYDSSRKPTPSKQKQPTRKRKKRMQRRRRRGVRGEVLAELPHVIGRMLHAIKFDFLRVDADFGLDDPADTGQLFGHLTPLIYGPLGQVNLRPDFGGACLRGTATAQFHVTPVALVRPMLGFLWRLLGPFK